MPKTLLGKWSVGLIIAFFVLFVLGNYVVSVQGPRDTRGQTILDGILSNPLLALRMLGGGIAAILTFFTGIVAIIKSKERSLLVYIATAIGLFFLWFLIGEILVPH